MKPRLGRPPKYDATMDRRVTIRCDKKKHNEIRAAADDEGDRQRDDDVDPLADTVPPPSPEVTQ